MESAQNSGINKNAFILTYCLEKGTKSPFLHGALIEIECIQIDFLVLKSLCVKYRMPPTL